jgi:hypothetical protein
MPPPIAHADAAHRRRLTLATLITLALGAWAVNRLAQELRALKMLAQSAPEEAADRFLGLAQWVLSVPAVGLALCALLLLRLAVRAWQSEMFPPPGARLLADQPLVTGADAKKRARLVFVLGGMGLVGAIVLPYVMYGRLRDVLVAAATKGMAGPLSG